MADAERVAAEFAADVPEEPEALSDAEYARQNLVPGETAFDLDDRRFVVDQVDLDSERVSLRDATFAEATGFPIFRSEADLGDSSVPGAGSGPGNLRSP